MVAYSSIFAWRIPWTEEPGGLLSMGLQRVRRDWATNTFTVLSCNRSVRDKEAWHAAFHGVAKNRTWLGNLNNNNNNTYLPWVFFSELLEEAKWGIWRLVLTVSSWAMTRVKDGLGFTFEYQHGSGSGISHPPMLGGGHTLAALRQDINRSLIGPQNLGHPSEPPPSLLPFLHLWGGFWKGRCGPFLRLTSHTPQAPECSTC